MSADSREQSVLDVLRDSGLWMSCKEIDDVADWRKSVSSQLTTMTKRGQLQSRRRKSAGCKEYMVAPSRSNQLQPGLTSGDGPDPKGAAGFAAGFAAGGEQRGDSE